MSWRTSSWWGGLVERLRELKERGSRTFELWRRLKLAENKAEALEAHVHYEEFRRREVERDVQQLREKLQHAAKPNPLIDAERLLKAAEFLIDPPSHLRPINHYEIRAWQAEVRQYWRDRNLSHYELPQHPGRFEQTPGGAWRRE